MNQHHRNLFRLGVVLVVIGVLALLIAAATQLNYGWSLVAVMAALLGIGVLALHQAVSAVLTGAQPQSPAAPPDRSDRVPDAF